MASTIRGALANRQVALTMYPAPRNLTESRLILEYLQRFGDISAFWNMKVKEHITFELSAFHGKKN